MAGDFEHRQLALQLAKRNWPAVAHCSGPDRLNCAALP